MTARAELGAGYGDFVLKAGGTAGSPDLVLQVGISLEAGLRMAIPMGIDAERIKTGTLSLVLPW